MRPRGGGRFRRAQAGMEAVPRMPMIWLDLKEAGEFAFNAAVKKVGPGSGRGGSRRGLWGTRGGRVGPVRGGAGRERPVRGLRGGGCL